MASVQQVKRFLDSLEFGEYVANVNDCDNAAVKAREALKQKWPRLVTGICIMYGFSFPGKLLGRHGRVKWIFVGHGILVAECEGRLYYDCTTKDGKDTRRFRCMEWLPAWWHYLNHGYLVIYKTIIWGDYVPASLIERMKVWIRQCRAVEGKV